jgi:hypothetical protein
MSISNYLEENLLKEVFNATGFAAVGTVYGSLHTADPGETGTAEVTGGTYARQVAAFTTASGGTCSNSGTLSWTNMPAGTVVGVGLWDALTTGNFLWGGTLTANKTTNLGDTFQIAPNDLDITLD